MKTVHLPALLVLLALAALAAMSGCSQALKEGVGVAFGAKGTYMPIEPLPSDALGGYQRFELGPIADGIGGKIPPEFLSLLTAEFGKELGDAKIANEPAGKTLILRGTIIHYETASTLGFALGPLEEVICLSELVDKDTGKALARANCLGRTTERVNAGTRKKAEGLAKAFVKWIESGYPKEQRRKAGG